MESASLIPNASQDIESTIWFKPQSSGAKNDGQYLIYFIPGNPGLISYYTIFMYTLSSLLKCSLLSSISADVCGSSLPGFGTAKSETIIKSRLPAGLEDQISNTEKLIEIAIATHKALISETGANAQPKVILMGHSVGAYILLEVLRRKRVEQSRLEDVDIVGGVLLFPTVTEIGQSRNGRIMRALYKIPFFIAIVAAIARILTFAFSATTLATIIGLLVRMPISAARASAEFIKSPRGVEQALYMARDEMEMITKDKWTHEIWGDAEAARQTSEDSPVPLYFYFGKDDKWVANDARDKLIQHRGRGGLGETLADALKPKMMIDKDGIPHGFILSHSEVMAEKAKTWIEEIIDASGTIKPFPK